MEQRWLLPCEWGYLQMTLHCSLLYSHFQEVFPRGKLKHFKKCHCHAPQLIYMVCSFMDWHSRCFLLSDSDLTVFLHWSGFMSFICICMCNIYVCILTLFCYIWSNHYTSCEGPLNAPALLWLFSTLFHLF